MKTVGEEVPDIAAQQIVGTRMLDAPRGLVFRMFVDPRHVVKWWGPNGFTNTIHEMDVRPGGFWRFVMHGPDGVDYRNEIRYIEVMEPERLVFDHGPSPKFRVTVTFDDHGGKTGLTYTMTFASADERERTVKTFGAVEGLKQTLGRLAEYVEAMVQAEDK